MFVFALGGAWGHAEDDDDGGPDKGEKTSTKVDVFFQELFMGQIAYPQDKGEIQFSTGFFQNSDDKREDTLPVVLEYGVTDYFQVAAAVPVDFKHHEEVASGVGNIELEAYWNFLNNPKTGWMSGVGFGVGLPAASPDVGDRAFLYEPFCILGRQVGKTGVNVSAGLEIKDYLDDEEKTEVKGDIAAGIYRQFDHCVPLLELGVEVEREKTTVRLAPGLYWQPAWTEAEIGVSLPIGLTRETPDFGVWVLATMEFQPNGHKDSDDD